MPFIAIGIGLLAIGMAGRRAFLFIGAAFIVIGIVRAKRAR